VMTGLGGTVAYDAFASKYLDPNKSNSYVADLSAFVADRKGVADLSGANAWTMFQELPAADRLNFVRQIFFKILRTTGVDAKRPVSLTLDNYNAGYDAIATLFPGKNYAGDLDMFYSQIKTMDGGDVTLMVPGGKINVGLAVVTSDIGGDRRARIPGELGLLTLRGGAINTFSADSVLVNQNRVFTLGGGDIVMWSSNGDIDAGKGAKTALNAPPPRLVYNSITGTYTAELSGEATGSGIGTLQTLASVPPGDVVLMAPHGTVNAGDSGIRVSGNLVIAAQFVVNTDNIQVKGTSIGVPTSVNNSAALTTANNIGAASQQLEKPSTNNGSEKASIIIVEVLGYGGGNPEGGDEGRKRDNKDRQSNYDPNGMFRVIGNGALTAEQNKNLTEEERAKL